jgi:hypothetical protein
LFTITIYKINKHIKEQNNLDLKELDEELIERTLLNQYRLYQDIFSKTASNKLLLYYNINHQIKLKKDYNLGYSPLYQIIVTKLKAIKTYLDKNLKKGFIILSKALFISPILFIAKPNNKLRFYINY